VIQIISSAPASRPTTPRDRSLRDGAAPADRYVVDRLGQFGEEPAQPGGVGQVERPAAAPSSSRTAGPGRDASSPAARDGRTTR
jgi:hypothetical protein